MRPLAAQAEDAGRTYRVGGVTASTRDAPIIVAMIDEAMLQYGCEPVAAYLGITTGLTAIQNGRTLIASLRGSEQKESAGIVFSRFLNYLRYCELKAPTGTVLEMGWFV